MTSNNKIMITQEELSQKCIDEAFDIDGVVFDKIILHKEPNNTEYWIAKFIGLDRCEPEIRAKFMKSIRALRFTYEVNH